MGGRWQQTAKSRWFLQEITATSAGNHGNFLRKSRQLPSEITATSATFLGDFGRKVHRFLKVFLRISACSHHGNSNFSLGFLRVPAPGTITFPEDNLSQLAFFWVDYGRFWGFTAIFHLTATTPNTAYYQEVKIRGGSMAVILTKKFSYAKPGWRQGNARRKTTKGKLRI